MLTIVPSIAGGSPGDRDRAAQAVARRGAAVLAPPAPARGRRRGPAQAQGGAGAHHRRRRAGLAARRSTWPRPASARSASWTSTWSTSPTCSGRSSTAPSTLGRPKLESAKARLHRSQPERERDRPRGAAHLGERARHHPGLRHRRRRHRQLPDPLPGERRLRAARASRTSTAASSASRARPRCSTPRKGPATAASTPSRRRRDWCRAAPRAACSACCPASSAASRRSRPSSGSSGPATR